MPHPFPAVKFSNLLLAFGKERAQEHAWCMTQRTDDDVYVPVREARIDQYTTDLLLPAARPLSRGRGGHVDVHVVRPLESHPCARLPAQRALVAARADDGQSDKILHEDEAMRGENRRAQRRADEDGELQAPRGREPRVGAAPAP